MLTKITYEKVATNCICPCGKLHSRSIFPEDFATSSARAAHPAFGLKVVDCEACESKALAEWRKGEKVKSF